MNELPEEDLDPFSAFPEHSALPVVPKERYDLRILKSLRRIVRAVDVYSRRLASQHGVTVPQLISLMKIDELGALTVKQLSEEVYLNPSTVVGIVDRLERAGLVARERSVLDRRQVRVLLTAAGREMLANSPSPLQASLVRSIEGLPELERVTIALSLERIIELIAREDDDSAPVLASGEDLRECEGVRKGRPDPV